ncbi:Lrp/AsnC family transcriptional regulator [Galactobacter caseinivorans]|uniref:Lrp/AsnC family transcriptional regulator n=1 Tax=Galactobacter caseinivorans TaxID=2676123 RepID=A0A496PJW6_9MICC|nr:Lrp/AsnC family transcriptional regulator [Galactobacter caseinivorans]RKW70776.1 Lrp/AsnC family transcriptional regulator [Galactobacter caseinivorans]
MHESPNSPLDALDFKIIHVLQSDPRISWRAAADALGTDAATVSRRWRRIKQGGHAWISVVEGVSRKSAVALVEISCRPGHVLAVAELLAQDPAVASVDVTSGRRDLLVTILGQDDDDLVGPVLSLVGPQWGVRKAQSNVVNHHFKLGSDWRLQALSQEELRRLPPPRPARAASMKRVEPWLATAVIELLSADGRATHAELGATVGVSPQRAADAVSRLRASGDLILRVDVALRDSDWPVVAWYFIQAPAQTVMGAQEALADFAELQFAATMTGPHSLIVAAACATRNDVVRVEAEIERRLPRAHIVDRSMVLRVYKHLGRVLDAHGRARPEPTGAESSEGPQLSEGPPPGVSGSTGETP